MGIVIFSLTILICYGIMTKAHKAFKNIEIKEKMEEIENIEEQSAEILKFKKAHKGNLNKKRETIENFKQE